MQQGQGKQYLLSQCLSILLVIHTTMVTELLLRSRSQGSCLIGLWEKTLESPLDCKEIQPFHSKGDQPWDFFGRNDAKAEAPVFWPPHAKSWLIGKDWCWEGLGAGGEGDDRGWDGWMASRTWWTWVWVNSGRWWWTGRPGVRRFMGSQRVDHDWATELNWTEKNLYQFSILLLYPEAWGGKRSVEFLMVPWSGCI